MAKKEKENPAEILENKIDASIQEASQNGSVDPEYIKSLVSEAINETLQEMGLSSEDSTPISVRNSAYFSYTRKREPKHHLFTVYKNMNSFLQTSDKQAFFMHKENDCLNHAKSLKDKMVTLVTR